MDKVTNNDKDVEVHDPVVIGGEIALVEVSNQLAIAPEYKEMLQRISDKLPAIKRDSDNFYKADSQFKNVTLDVTELTAMGSLKHILAVLDRTRMALEEAHIAVKRKQIQMKQKQEEYDKETDDYKKDLLNVDIVELAVQISNTENSIRGAIRKMSFFTTQYEAIMQKMGKDEITEEDYELNEARHHVMTAMKQALNAARTRGGVIDEGNHIYLFDMGINGAAAQAEVFAYLEMENDLMKNGIEPTHEMTIKWLEACADKFADSGKKFAESRGFIPLDKKSLAKEIPSGKESN
jgi:hypothetical protein